MSALHLVVLGAAVLNLLVFLWGVWGVFVKGGKASLGLTVILVTWWPSGGLMVWAIATSPPLHLWNAVASLSMLAASLALFAACARVNRTTPLTRAYSQDPPQHVQHHGPYRWVRHPFYVSYLLTYAGGAVATMSPWALLVLVWMAGLYLDAARTEERKFASSGISGDYAAYRERTGMFFPRLS